MRWLILASCLSASAADWTQFRGPNASGVAGDKNLPVEFGPEKNLIWKTKLPPGHSSPVFSPTHIFVSAYDGDKIQVIAMERKTGRVAWRRDVPRPRKEELHKENTAASASPVTDGKNVYAFFTDFGLVSFGPDGNERWRQALGPFNNPMGMASSPVLSGNTIVLNLDGETGSYITAFDKETGKQKWKTRREEYTRGFSTPVLWKSEDGRTQAIVAGSYRLVSYDVETGAEIWSVGGLTWQLKPTPVLDGNIAYVLGWAGGSDNGQQEDVPEFSVVLSKWDTNKDGKLQKDEFPDKKMVSDWGQMDLDHCGAVNERDWKMYQARRKAVNQVMAVKLGGKGDVTESNVLWRYYKSLPNATSPLFYEGVVYLVKEGGILTSLDAKTGAVLKQGRLTGAPNYYYSSPVAADGKIYTASHEGKVVVIKAGGEWELLKVNDLNEDINSTPAIVDSKLYIRTHENLYCFGLAK